jgi:PmbA protein
VDGGKRSEAEIRRDDYLEVVEYSSFQVDAMGGDIAGEIRLGYLHRGGEVRIVSGGSVTGQMADVIPTMEFSAETEQYDTFVIPRVTLLKNLKITGIE